MTVSSRSPLGEIPQAHFVLLKDFDQSAGEGITTSFALIHGLVARGGGMEKKRFAPSVFNTSNDEGKSKQMNEYRVS